MAHTDDQLNNASQITESTLRRLLHFQRIANAAVAKAQAENRALGIPNWYSINGRIVSDQQLDQQLERPLEPLAQAA
jgi:hypothetical protein